MQIGVSGKKYGLQRPAGLSLFKPEDEEEKDVNEIIRDASAKKALKQKQQEQAKVLADDPTAYDYDSVYDAMHQSRKAAVPHRDSSRKPKYIHALLEKAAVRNREQDIVYSRMLQKERETEGNTFAGKEKFLTSAYKKKLQENKLWQEEEDRKAALEEDVTKKEDLGSFYVNLLTHNEAYGGGRRSSPPGETHGDSNLNHKPADKVEEKEDSNVGSIRKKREQSSDMDEPHEDTPSSKEDSATKNEDTNNKRSREIALNEAEYKASKYGTETKHARKNDDSTVSAARERYLKRKSQTQW